MIIFYNESDQFILLENPNVVKVSDRSISYQPDFKVRAVKENLAGKTPTQVFVENGFNLQIIGQDKPATCLKRWRNIFQKYGEKGLRDDRRGTGSTGRPTTKDLSAEEKLKRAEARIQFLEAENELLKKIKEIERRR
jgi:transposase